MSSQVGSLTRSVARFGRAPRITRHLRKDRQTQLPIPHVNIITRQFAPCRLEDHYHSTLADDLMYMTFLHASESEQTKQRQIRLKYDPEDPYARNRHNPPVGGAQMFRKPPPPSTPENTIRLEKIQIHVMAKDAIQQKNNLLGLIMAMRALTGESYQAGGRHAAEGIQIIKGKKAVGGWIRPGVPAGVKVDLKGQSMYDFLGTLTEFVFPRLRDFQGIQLPPQSSSVKTPNAVSGVVSFGLPPDAFGLFPQIEVNLDSYPKNYGMHLHFITNAKGQGAQNRARALVSGFQIPFLRK